MCPGFVRDVFDAAKADAGALEGATDMEGYDAVAELLPDGIAVSACVAWAAAAVACCRTGLQPRAESKCAGAY